MRSLPLIAALLIVLTGSATPAHAAAPANTETPTISGSAREGQTLTSSTGAWTGTDPIAYARRWQRCDAAGVECVNLNATGATYTLVAADAGSAIRVVVTATNADGVVTATSAPTAAVAGIPPENTVAPAISGNARQGQALTAARGTWTGTAPIAYGYEWRRCDAAGADCIPIENATAATYVLTGADVGGTVRARVHAANIAASVHATTAATAVIGPPAPPVNASAPAVSGTARDGQTLSSTTGTWSGAATITYARRWQRCNSLGMACVDTTSTGATYPLTAADVGATVRVVVTATNPDGTATATSAATPVVAANPPAATVAPAVSGGARVGQTLSATTGTWTGTAPIAYSRGWLRCGETCTPIDGAAAATYTLTAEDLGHTLRHAVTATNEAGSAAAQSSATAAIGPAQPPVYSAPPAVGGTARDGQTLTSATGTWTGTATIAYARRWQRCDAAGANCSDTASTATTYPLTSADVGATIRLVVTATNPDGTAAAASAATEVIAPLAPANSKAPAITGTARDGQTLTAGTGTWTGTAPITYAYEWRRCADECVAVATGPTYTLRSADVGATFRVHVTAANAGGSAGAASTLTPVVAVAAPAAAAPPTISGTARDGMALTGSDGSWNGTAPMAYAHQWQRCSATGTGCTNITGATTTTYSLVTADVGATIKLRVTATNSAGSTAVTSAQSPPVAAAPPANTGAPSVSGAPEDGQLLTASPGDWSGSAPLGFAYAWERCQLTCVTIAGGQSYRLTSADVGGTVRVRTTATNGAGSAEATSPATGPVQPLAPTSTTAPAVSGSARDGQTLSATAGGWVGTTPMATSHQWLRCGDDCMPIAGATAATYTLGADDVGATIRVAVTASNAGGSESVRSAPTPIVSPLAPVNVVAPAVSGTARDGRTLLAAAGEWTGTPAIELEYQWQRCDGRGCQDVVGATTSEYTLVTADVGRTMRIAVRATNGGGTTTAVSGATGTVQPNPPVNLAPPTVTGDVRDGELLTATEGDWTGLVTIAVGFRWWRCDAGGSNCGVVAGATERSYRLTPADVHLTLRVEAVAANAGGTTSAFSAPTGVAEPSPPLNGTPPVIGGRHGVGQMLTVERGTWTGSPTIAYEYQWLRCDGDACVAIPGADADAYRLTPDDLGATLRARVRATNPAGGAQATSQPTRTVRDDPPVPAAPPAITGTPLAEGVELKVTGGEWTGGEPMLLAYQWRRCDATGSLCTDIAGATGATYRPLAADVGSQLRVRVSADNGVGEGAQTSALTGVVQGAPPVSTALPLVSASGLRPGRDLTATPGRWTGAAPIAVAYQWLRCGPDGESCVAIPDGTAPKLTLTAADIGTFLRVRVTAGNATASAAARSAPVGPVEALPPTSAAKPKVTADGRPREGTILRADSGVWNGTAPIRIGYRWQRCAGAGDCRDIPGADMPEYTAGPEDVGRRLRVVVAAENVLAKSTAESALSETVLGRAPSNAIRPELGGRPRDGETLTARAGEWTGSPPWELSFAWARCSTACRPIKGATGSTYALGPEDVGQRIAVVVTAAGPYGRGEAQSLPTEPVAAIAPKVVRRPRLRRPAGVLAPGVQITSRPASFVGTQPLQLTHQWLRCDGFGRRCLQIPKATAPTYEPAGRDFQRGRLAGSLVLVVTAANAAGEVRARSSALFARSRRRPVRVELVTVRRAPDGLHVLLRCSAGGAACSGRLVVAARGLHATAGATVEPGQAAAVPVRLRRRERRIAQRVKVTFLPDVGSAGRAVARRLAIG